MAYWRAGSLLLAMAALFVAIGSLFGTEGAAWALARATSGGTPFEMTKDFAFSP